MPDPTFSQPERRSNLIPIVAALAALAIAIFIAVRFFPATTVNVDHLHSEAVDTHTVFESKTMVLAPQQAQDVLYVVETLKVDNQLRLAISLDDFHLTLTNPDGKQLTVKASQKDDLPTLRTSFPKLAPLLTEPLLRETNIEPGRSVQGALIFALPVPKAMWEARQSGVVKIDLYHQPSLYLTIPK